MDCGLARLALLGLLFVATATKAATEGPYTYTVTNNQATITQYNPGFPPIPGPLSITNTLGGNPVTSIGDWAFQGANTLSAVTLPDTVTNIGSYAFYGCFSIGTVTVPTNVTHIGEAAFFSCSALTNIAIPPNLTTIANWTFLLCWSLRSIRIPASVTNIGDGAFEAFSPAVGLTSVYFAGNPPTPGTDILKNTDATIYYLPAFAPNWPTTYADHPTAVWRPTITGIQNAAETNGFSLGVSWAPDTVIVVETCTNLTAQDWTPLQTNKLSSDVFVFQDPDSTNYPTRFYRIVGP